MLPTPTTLRFQPLRSGLINLFKYQVQEFWYERGRLLIRGNNGSGKSRVLALQLPFLLDGEISPRRVEPDGDSARQIAWHLLMDEHEQRTGYTWIEFGRRDESGTEHYLTLGCGMKAVRGGDNQPTRWFFITERRVGGDFQLLDGAHPLSQDRLAEVLGPECLYKAAKNYRAEIDRRMFSLGEARYAALIELLIRLRAPQLAKKLEEKTIFAALSDALPPLSEEVVRQVAEAFKNLDDLREQFTGLQSLAKSLAGFRTDYQSYVQVAIQRRAETVRSCHSQYEAAQRRVNGIEQEIATATAGKAQAEEHAGTARKNHTAADAHYDALSRSTAAGDAQRLDEAKVQASDKARLAGEAETRERLADERLQISEGEYEKQYDAHERDLTARDAASKEAARLAQPAGFCVEHAKLFPSADTWPADTAAMEKLKAAHKREADNHLYRLEQITEGLAVVEKAQSELKAAQLVEDQLARTADAHRDDVQRHDQAASSACATLAADYAEWKGQLRRLAVPAWSELAPAFDDWLETAGNSHRVLPDTIASVQRDEAAALATARAELKASNDQLLRERHEMEVERAALATSPPPPPVPRTRDEPARTGRPGAPLWQVCEFHPSLSPQQRAGLEAALEASGLLDAWVSPDGTLTGDLPGDTFLNAGDRETAASGATLADWLIPDLAADSSLTPTTWQRVLRRIGAGEGQGAHWMALDGRWQLGPVFGRGVKSEAQHLGATSREIARLRRLAEIEESLRQLVDKEADLRKAADSLNAREREGRIEVENAPRDEDIARYLTLRTEARLKLQKASAAHAEALQQTHRARQAASALADKLRESAIHLGYREHLDRLPALRPAYEPYDKAMVKLWGDAQAWLTAAQQLEAASGRARMAEEAKVLASDEAGAAQTAALRADQAFKALKESLGSSVSEYQVMLQTAREAKAEAQRILTAAGDAVIAAAGKLAESQATLQPAQEKVNEVSAARIKAIQALRVPLLFGLFPEAHASLADIETEDWSPTRAAAIARRIGKELPESNLSDDAWTIRLNMLNTQIIDLQNRTGAACEIQSQILSEGLMLVECRYQSILLKPAACLDAVERERETHERLLGERERDIIDRHLVTEVSMQLRTLIESARESKDRMNEEMSRCATTLGVTLRLVWDPLSEGLPPGLPAVRKLLLADHAAWTAEERTAVGNCLHQLIQNQRIENPQDTAAAQLLRALDYRQWHCFYAERRQNEKWERLTKKKYGTGSGGEKALMLTIPQMAAASSHYQTAASHAPRLILLDEAFAGLDPPTRARLMGLMEAFDLDVVMTSEREWGTHATVSGIAIYQLVANAEAVSATRWVWNGKTRMLAPVPDTPEFQLTP